MIFFRCDLVYGDMRVGNEGFPFTEKTTNNSKEILVPNTA